MKKNNILLSALAVSALFVGCEDTRLNGIPASNVYMARSGQQVEPMYDLNRKETIQVSAVKSGYYNTPVSVDLAVGTQADIDVYNNEFSTTIEMMPTQHFTFPNVTLKMGEKELYAVSPMVIDIPALNDLQKANPTKVYGAPVIVTGATLPVNEARKLSIYSFQILPAVASFSKFGEQEITFAGANDLAEVTFDISVPFQNDWDLDCTIEESDETFNKFNAEKAGVFTRIPTEALIGLPKTVRIPKGSKTATIKFSVSKSKAGIGFFAFVPTLTAIDPADGAAIVIIPEVGKDFYAATVSTAADLPRTGWKVLPSPFTEPNEGSEAALLDGDLATFWHSKWSGGTAAPAPTDPSTWQYVIVEMDKVYEVAAVKLAPRSATPSHCTAGYIELSEDGTTYVNAGTYECAPKAGFQNFPLKGQKAQFIKIWATSKYGQFAEAGAQGAEVK